MHKTVCQLRCQNRHGVAPTQPTNSPSQRHRLWNTQQYLIWWPFPGTKNVKHVRCPPSYKHVTSHYDVKRCTFILNNNILQHNHQAHWCTCPTLAISFTTTHTQPISIPQHHSFSMTVTQHTSDTKPDAVISLRPSGPNVPLLRWLKQRLKCHQSHNMKKW